MDNGIGAGRPVRMELSVGDHPSPAGGTCLMELASVIAGESFGAHPQCVHPGLAALARLVNDHVGYHARQRLIPLLPLMMTYERSDPVLDWAVIVGCLQTAAEMSDSSAVGRQLARNERRLARAEARAGARDFALSGARRRAIGLSVTLETSWIALGHGEDALVELLINAVAAYTGAQLRAQLPAPPPDIVVDAAAEPVLR